MRSRLSGPGSFRILGWIVAVVLLGPGFLRAAGGKSDERPPNLIVILADDLGAKELACYGNREHRTPNLDRLARTGVEFATCYATPICHPTRFEIMTGQYGSLNGVFHFPGRRGGPNPRGPADQIVNHITFAQVLKSLPGNSIPTRSASEEDGSRTPFRACASGWC